MPEAAAGRGPWALHNLAETLPHPTPLTWSVIRPFMAGAGGFGAMYRQAGFERAAAEQGGGISGVDRGADLYGCGADAGDVFGGVCICV